MFDYHFLYFVIAKHAVALCQNAQPLRQMQRHTIIMKGVIDVDCKQSPLFPLSHIRSREHVRGDKKQGCHNLSSLNKVCTINLANITFSLMAHGSEKRMKVSHRLFIMV